MNLRAIEFGTQLKLKGLFFYLTLCIIMNRFRQVVIDNTDRIGLNAKEIFLLEHNKLCSLELRATMQLLSHFETEKPGVCRSANWSVDKLRRPFIMWLTSLKETEIRAINQEKIRK